MKNGEANYVIEGDDSDSTQLNKLLKPAVFIRRDDDGDFKKFVYIAYNFHFHIKTDVKSKRNL
ncbi:MAG: hypothetical protein ACOCQB_02110, partial [Halanaerobiaceae bacterium]